MIETISNMLVILLVLNRQLRETCTAILLTNLLFSDLIICAVYVPMYIFDINNGSGHRFEEVRFRMEFGLFIASLNGEFSVTLDHFIAISFLYCLSAEWRGGVFRRFCSPRGSWRSFWPVLSLLTDTPLYSFFYIAALIILIVAFNVAMYLVARWEAKKIASQHPLKCQEFPFWSKFQCKGCYYRGGNIAAVLGTDRDRTRCGTTHLDNFQALH